MQITALRNYMAKKDLLVFFVFFILSLLLFAPVLHKSFASDDFLVLHRLVYKKKFFINDFFRPLSDFSLYGSYLAGGFNPLYYNAVNVIVHASCAFLLYRFCLIQKFLVTGNVQLFAWLSAILFLVYPFHNEAVIWALCRGIVLSGFFGFLSLLILFTQMSDLGKYSLSCLFYFIGLLGYETILPLPFIALFFLYLQNKSIKNLLLPAAGYLTATLVNIIMRLQLSDAVWGSYGNAIFSSSFKEYCVKFLKVAGRFLLPPSQFSLILNVFFAALLLFIVVIAVFILRKKNKQSAGFISISTVTFLSCSIPAIFGINTRTYEGDRVFYFSSFFLCIWIAYLLSFVKNRKWWWSISGCIFLYFVFFFYQGELTWRKSGIAVDSILNSVRNMKHADKKLYLINMPGEYNGAQIFRNGFKEALLINSIDTAGVAVINYLSTEQSLQLKGTIRSADQQQGVFIFPGTVIRNDSIMAKLSAYKNLNASVYVKLMPGDRVYFWNKESFVLIK